MCKAAVSREKLIPLYGRGQSTNRDPRNTIPTEGRTSNDNTSTTTTDEIPSRPQGQRTEFTGPTPPYQHPFNPNDFTNAANAYPFGVPNHDFHSFAFNFGIFPSLFGFTFAWPPPNNRRTNINSSNTNNPTGQNATQEQINNEFLSRILLFIGLFFILCLLSF